MGQSSQDQSGFVESVHEYPSVLDKDETERDVSGVTIPLRWFAECYLATILAILQRDNRGVLDSQEMLSRYCANFREICFNRIIYINIRGCYKSVEILFYYIIQFYCNIDATNTTNYNLFDEHIFWKLIRYLFETIFST